MKKKGKILRCVVSFSLVSWLFLPHPHAQSVQQDQSVLQKHFSSSSKIHPIISAKSISMPHWQKQPPEFRENKQGALFLAWSFLGSLGLAGLLYILGGWLWEICCSSSWCWPAWVWQRIKRCISDRLI